MGSEVEEVPGGASVAAAGAAKILDQDGFGRWYREQRELRGISIFVVGARTKLPPNRIEAIEAGLGDLGRDGHSRITVRELALAIGADPEHALARLLIDPTRSGDGGHARFRPESVVRRLLPTVAAALVLALGIWGFAVWLDRDADPEDTAEVMHRTDYVREALDSTP